MNLIAPRLGRSLILLASAALFFDAFLQLASGPSMVAAMEHIGYPSDAGPSLSLLTFACALLLTLPATSFVGAVLTTGFLGGAIAVHVPASGLSAPPQLICVVIGACIWFGLFLADARVSDIAGFRQPSVHRQ